MKNNLYLDMVLKHCNIVLFDKNIIKDKLSVLTHNDLVDNVANYLDEFLMKNNLDFSEINSIYVNIGPGSFTGVKAAVNVAKTIKCVYHNINIYTITTDLMFSSGNGITCIDAKSNKWFLSVYENKKCLHQLSLVDSETKQEIIKKYNHLNIYNEENVANEQIILNAINNLDLFKLDDDYLKLEPVYLKEPC